jgi:drug/metabolite transporter (DMT)-like permease
MYAFSVASLTTIYTLSYTSSLFMIVLSALILKEKIAKEKWIAVAIGMVGVIIAMRPGTSVFEMAAIVVLFGTFLGSLNKILMRRLAATEHSLAIAVYPNVAMILVTFPFLIATWQPMTWHDLGFFAIVGVITAAGQYAIAHSLRFAQGSTLASMDYSTFFWVVMLDFFWWDRVPDKATLIGAAVIVGSNLYILFRSRREQAEKKQTVPAS